MFTFWYIVINSDGTTFHPATVKIVPQVLRIHILVKSKRLIITTSLSYKLGFEGKTEFSRGEHVATEAYDMNRDTRYMFI